MYVQHETAKFVHYKNTRFQKVKLLNKMRLLLHLKAFQSYGHCTYLEIMVKEKQLAREIFLLDVSQGDEVCIPNEI